MQNCSYSKSTGTKERNGTNTTYYYCNHSGSYSSKGKGARTLKSQGSCKIDGHCTSTIKLIEKVGCNEVEMNICKTHYGHKVELGHIPIPKADKLLIGCKRKLGIDKTRIINDIQDSTTAGRLICSLYRLINKHLKICTMPAAIYVVMDMRCMIGKTWMHLLPLHYSNIYITSLCMGINIATLIIGYLHNMIYVFMHTTSWKHLCHTTITKLGLSFSIRSHYVMLQIDTL